MIDTYNPEDFERLKQEVETLVGRSVKTPKDFEFLSRQIEGYTNETISVSTLKRMWDMWLRHVNRASIILICFPV